MSKMDFDHESISFLLVNCSSCSVAIKKAIFLIDVQIFSVVMGDFEVKILQM